MELIITSFQGSVVAPGIATAAPCASTADWSYDIRSPISVRGCIRQSLDQEHHRMPEPAPVSPHILVVEVDPALQLLIQTTLAGMGYASTLASSLEEALRLLHKHPFDLVVTRSEERR